MVINFCQLLSTLIQLYDQPCSQGPLLPSPCGERDPGNKDAVWPGLKELCHSLCFLKSSAQNFSSSLFVIHVNLLHP